MKRANEKMFFRSAELEERAVDEATRSTTLSFSSEKELRRWFGTEILSHKDGHVNVKAVNSLLMNHNPNLIVGPVKSKKIENGRGVAEVGFDDTPEGELRMKQVQNKSLKGVSVGYIVEKFKKLNPDEEWTLCDGRVVKGGAEDNPTYIAVKWAPIEISLTPIPADSSVGIGRDLTRSLEGIEIEGAAESEEERQRNLFDENGNRINAQTEKTETPATGQGGGKDMDEKVLQAALGKRDQEHRDGLKKLYDRASAIGQEALVFRLISEGKDEKEITDALFEAVGKERGKPADVGEGTRDAEVKLDSIDDETLMRGLTSPTLVTLD